MKLIRFVALCSLLFCSSSVALADQGAISVLNELLKGEISAVETYRQALEKLSSDSAGAELKKFHAEHQNAVKTLEQQVVKLGGTPVASSGAWGVWAEAVTGTAKVFGKETALKALKEGEEHGVKEYQEVLENKNAPAEVKALVRSTLLPQQEAHIQALSKMISEKQAS